jgi:spore germination protein GerM
MNTRAAAAGLVILALIAGGFALYFTRVHAPKHVTPPVSISSPSTTPAPVANETPPARHDATIYTVDEAHGDENGLAPMKVALADPKSPARSALEALIDTSNSPIPEGTSLRGLKINAGVATVDFSSEFQKNFHGGDMQEAAAVNSVLMTLGQFHTIDRVQILVDGSPIDTLGGHFEISTPLDVIRPTSTRQAKNE